MRATAVVSSARSAAVLSPRPLTPHQEDVLVAVVNAGGGEPAAHVLGISRYAIAGVLTHVRRNLNAAHTTHAAVLMFRRLGYRYLESPERRRLFDVAMQWQRAQ